MMEVFLSGSFKTFKQPYHIQCQGPKAWPCWLHTELFSSICRPWKNRTMHMYIWEMRSAILNMMLFWIAVFHYTSTRKCYNAAFTHLVQTAVCSWSLVSISVFSFYICVILCWDVPQENGKTPALFFQNQKYCSILLYSEVK